MGSHLEAVSVKFWRDNSRRIGKNVIYMVTLLADEVLVVLHQRIKVLRTPDREHLELPKSD
jgi:hypothetical protein